MRLMSTEKEKKTIVRLNFWEIAWDFIKVLFFCEF